MNPEIRHAAVGIPQGLILDRDNSEIAGAVRRGGELVSLDPVEYRLWTALLTPLTLDAAIKVARAYNVTNPGPVIERLGDLGLTAPIDLDAAANDILLGLRPLPLGCGLGNMRGDSANFEIQNTTLSRPSPISLDVLSVMFWWEFDGTSTLREIASVVASRVPGLSLDRANSTAAELACGLMINRMLYLDSPRPATN